MSGVSRRVFTKAAAAAAALSAAQFGATEARACRHRDQRCGDGHGRCCNDLECVDGRCQPPEPTPTADATGSWVMVFRDDFNGTSIDQSKWNAQFPWGGSRLGHNGEIMYYQPFNGRNYNVHDGMLSLTAIKETVVTKEGTHAYSSGLIQTRNKFNFTSGYFKARVRTPNTPGAWPAFWTLPVDYSVDARPEWDIGEWYGDEAGVHHQCWHLPGAINGCHNDSGVDVWNWHTYGLVWDATNAIWYRDGREVYRRAGGFPEPSYLLLNLAVTNTLAGDISKGVYPARFDIDYVYAWRRT